MVTQHAAQSHAVWQSANCCKPMDHCVASRCGHKPYKHPLSPSCRQDSLEKIARSFLGFDAIIQKEGLAPSDAEVHECMHMHST